MLVLLAAQEGEWDELDGAVRRFQQANMALKYAPKPVVAAPFGMTLGGGCEIALHAARVQASAELYMGLVEVGVGLIPAGGGCKEMLLRTGDAEARVRADRLRQSFLQRRGRAALWACCVRRRDLDEPRAADRRRQSACALRSGAGLCAAASRGTISPSPARPGYALLKMGVYMAREGGYISEYDAVIGEKLAHVLSGGRLTGEQKVSEQYLLDLEREAFLSLCGQPKTQQRMQHMLKTGKPLRN